MQCVVCQLPNRTPERGQVCEPDRARIGRNLRDIGDLYQRIDLQPGRGAGGSRPTGKPGSRMPLAVDPLDLTMPSRQDPVIDGRDPETKIPYRDQIGHNSVASVLDSWVRDWCDQRGKGESFPVPTVAVLVHWLLDRYQEACDTHLAIDDFAFEIKRQASTLRAVCGEIEPRPERVWVPCPNPDCDLLTLRRTPGESYPIRCMSCGYAGTEEEFQQYVGLCAAAVKRGEFPPKEPLDMIVMWRNTSDARNTGEVMVA